MTHTTINRRRALAVVAAIPAAAALSAPALASVGEDAELRELWAKYLEQLEAYGKADAAHSEKRAALNAEIGPVPWGGYDMKIFQSLWNKHGLEPVNEAWNREDRKLRRIAKAIRKAKAETMFGVGVKLTVLEGLDGDKWQLEEAIDDALRAICDLTGVDFIAATGKLEV